MRSVPPDTPRTGLPSSGTTYTPTPPSAPRSFTAPSSSRSRDSVAWVTSMPSSASIAASSLWLRTECDDTSAMMRACRPTRVADVMRDPASLLAAQSCALPASLLAAQSCALPASLLAAQSCALPASLLAAQSCALQQPYQERLLGMQPILGFVPHGALRPVDDVVGDFV